MAHTTSKALSDLLHSVSKNIEYKASLVSKKQSLALLEATRALWNDVYEEQIESGQENYFSSNLNGLAIDSKNVDEKLTLMIKEVSEKNEAPFVGQFWGRNLEVLSSTFENFKYSDTAGKLIEPYLSDLVEVSKL
jgi:hypothetical protein